MIKEKIIKLTIRELAEALKKEELSSVDIVEAYLDRIKKVDKKINAFLAINDEALLEAKNSDKRRSAGKEISKLDGIPIGIKDVILTKKLETTAASKMLKGFLPLEDATVVKRLKDAGMIVLGKNNCDAWAHGGSTENSDFGPTKNPYDYLRVPGGSSGGSTAAVAAFETPVSIGTDTGGSIRQPSGFCGVVGMKPTYGLCSRYGLIAMTSSLDVPGPITNSVYDNALILGIMAGSDEKDATSFGVEKRDYLKNINTEIKGLKIGVPKEYFDSGLSKEVRDSVIGAIDFFKKNGAKIIETSLPNTKYGIATYYVIQPAEVSSNLSRYNGISYGYSSNNSENLIDHYFKSRTEGLGSEAKRRIMLGNYVLSSGYYDAYYKKAMRVRALIKKDFEDAFKKCDVIIGPTSPSVAFRFGEHKKNSLSMYLQDAYTVNANLAGIPSLALPCGWANNSSEKNLSDGSDSLSLLSNSGKLPIGMQIMGPQFSEDLLYQVGYFFENHKK